MNNKEQGFIGGAAVHKELQGFAAVLAYQSCHQDGGSITKAMIEARIGLKYFGNPNDADSIGLVEQDSEHGWQQLCGICHGLHQDSYVAGAIQSALWVK